MYDACAAVIAEVVAKSVSKVGSVVAIQSLETRPDGVDLRHSRVWRERGCDCAISVARAVLVVENTKMSALTWVVLE